MLVDLHAKSDVGRVRRGNEDNFLLLDLATGLCVFAVLLRFGRRAALIGLCATFLSPLMFLLSCYGLTETLATCLATVEVWLALRAMRSRLLLHAALCGLVAGLAQLVRNDAVTVAPAVALAIYWSAEPLRRRAAALALATLIGVAVFAPWPLRNLYPYVEFNYDQLIAGPAGQTFPQVWVTPGLAFMNYYIELSVATQLALNKATVPDTHARVIVLLDLFIDDIFPWTNWTPVGS